MLSVTDSWVKWLWQHTEAWRIRFQVAPESVPAPICQLKNRSSDYQSQLTRSQPHEGLLGRGKAQSNTNKHEDQQMALSQSLYLSLSFFFFFLNLTLPLSVLHLHLLILSWQANILFNFLYLSFQIPLFSPHGFLYPLHLSPGASAANVTCSSVRCSPLPHTAVITLPPCYFTPTAIGGAINERMVLDFILWSYW